MANWVDARGKLIEDATDIAGETIIVNGQPVSASNPLPVTGGTGGGGGTGDASALNQTTQITLATELNTAFGDQTDASAGSDAGANSLISLFKRLLTRLTFFINLFPTSIGAKTGAASLSVVPATDATFPVPGVATATNQTSQITIATTIQNRLPPALGANGGVMVDIVGGSAGGGGGATSESFLVTATMTRAASVAAYAVNNVINSAVAANLVFPGVGSAVGQKVTITFISVDYAGTFTSGTSFPSYLLFVSPNTFATTADHAALALTNAERTAGIVFQVGETVTIPGASIVQANNLFVPITLGAASTSLNATLIASVPFTPPAANGDLVIKIGGFRG